MQLPIPLLFVFLLIRVIWLSGFYTYPMDKGSVQWIAIKTEWFICSCHIMVTWRHNLP